MSFQATIVSIMLGGPSDTSELIDAIRQAFLDWNATHAERRKIVILPRHWKTHAAPTTGQKAQQVIDKQVVSESDALIAVFKGHRGTPINGQDSGTIHEINEFVATGKVAQIYFQDKVLVATQTDSHNYTQLLAWKNDIKEKALYAEFTDTNDL